MKNKIKSFFKKVGFNVVHFWKDNFCLSVSFICLVLAGLHGWQYFASGFNINCLYRIIMFVLVFPFTLLFGRKAVYIILIIFSLFSVWINTFNNYTGFFCILLSCRFYRKSEKWLLIIYAINTVTAFMINKMAISHIVIHCASCLFFYAIYFFVNRPKTLELTEDESRILNELVTRYRNDNKI